VVCLLLGLVWLLAGGVSGRHLAGCGLDGAAAAVMAVAACAPPLFLCAIGLALGLNRPIALLLLPLPLVSWVVLWLGAQAISMALGVSASACIVPGDGPPTDWEALAWWPTFLLSLLGTVGVPLLGGSTVARSDPAAVARSRELFATTFTGPRVVRGLAIAAAAAAALLLVGLLWPVTLDERALEAAPAGASDYPVATIFFEGPVSSGEAPPPSAPTLNDRLLTWKIRFSLLRGGGFRLLGTDLERRLGPVQWALPGVHGFPTRAVVSATGHFPDATYRPSYQRRRSAFETCKDQVRSDERFIREWSRSVAGLLTPDEISWTAAVFRREEFALVRRYERHSADWCVTEDTARVEEALRERDRCCQRPPGGSYVGCPDTCEQVFWKQLETMKPRPPGQLIAAWKRDTSDLLEPGEWTRLAGSLRRDEFLGLQRTCDELWWNRLRQDRGGTTPGHITAPLYAECTELNPGSEEEFSRIVFEWECAGLRCRWRSIDVAAWQRALAVPCRTTGTAACLDEALDYLARGRIGGAP
jgi:hypothetical protein